MDIVFIVTSAAFFMWLIQNITTWALLWVEKDYDAKRVFYHLIETAKGKKILFSPLSIIKWLAVIFYIYTIFEEKYLFAFHVGVIGIYITQAFFVLKNIFLAPPQRKLFKREAIIVVLVSFTTLGLIFVFPLLDKYFWLLFVDRITALIVSIFIFFITFPIELMQDKDIEKAIKKIKSQKDLVTIGIVGSYGKSSTKVFLHQLLARKYKVVKTQGHQITLAEIARTVIRRIKKSTQIFIVEINDFSKGDIKKVTEVVRPSIGVITGVNPQYLSLFRTLNESTASKKELIEALPKKSLVVFNGSDSEVKKLYDIDKKTKMLYFLNKELQETEIDKRAIFAVNKKVLKDRISFDIMFMNNKIRITSPLIGRQNIENLLPAIFLASYLGMSDSEVKKAALTLSPPASTMVRRENKDGVVFIDDTTSTNPESLFAALDYMKLYKKKKIVIMQTMIEIGGEAKNMHIKIAQKIAEQCDTVFITNNDYLSLIEKTISKSASKCKVLHTTPKKTAEYINENTSKGDIILFEGFEAKTVLSRLK